VLTIFFDSISHPFVRVVARKSNRYGETVGNDDETAQSREHILASLPPAPQPVALYTAVREWGGLLYVAGQTPHVQGELEHRGRVGTEVSVVDGRHMARRAALNVVAALQHHLGTLDQLEGVLSLTGFVACAADFTDHPAVINGASELFVELFGQSGVHARAAVGVSSLPGGAPVEISVIAALRQS
jgi:enamine deaminase RidA (YjgF/YER057c/UK114 family)